MVDRVVPAGECYDCGGRCVLDAGVRAGGVVRIEPGGKGEPEYRACAKGRGFRQMLYAPGRLRYPLKRTGRRGEGKFERISWDEALDTIAGELNRIRATYGPASIFYVSGSGCGAQLHGFGAAMLRLLNMFGGCTVKWGSASAEGSRFSSSVTFGTLQTSNSRDDLLNSQLIVMWGWNPAVSIQGRNTGVYLARAHEAGTRIIAVDPRFSESVAVFADEWIPIRPNTDGAALAAIACVMIKEGLHDTRFLDKYALGFDRFRDYVLGTEDGVAKTPGWAEPITGIPAGRLERLAREYAATKPAALMPGFAPGRTAYGEQFHRLCATLAAMTGNIGNHGGSAAGHGLAGPVFSLPPGENPVEWEAPKLVDSLDPVFKSRYRVQTGVIWDAILKGKAGGYPADFKLVYITNCNPMNQYLNCNKGDEALRKPEFIVDHEQFMTATARYADIVLPVNTPMERNDVSRPTYPEGYFVYTNKAVEALGESKSDFDIAVALAPRLGLIHYSDRDEESWLREIVRNNKAIPDYDEFRRQGIHRVRRSEPWVTFKPQIEDPEHNSFPTPSGKIEIYSPRLALLDQPGLPSIPKYIEGWEGPADPLAAQYPLQLITAHSRRRANSCFEAAPWMRETDRQCVTMSAVDAGKRGIRDGDMVRVSNARGQMMIPARVTERIMPGVVEINQGAWFQPDEGGIDRGGCPNVLTRDDYSPGGAFPSNTCLVQVEGVRQ